jgi:hypothetical protein
MKVTKNIGFLLLAVWLILSGLSAFAPISDFGSILSLLAIAAGALILLGR